MQIATKTKVSIFSAAIIGLVIGFGYANLKASKTGRGITLDIAGEQTFYPSMKYTTLEYAQKYPQTILIPVIALSIIAALLTWKTTDNKDNK